MAEAICRKKMSEKLNCAIDALGANGYIVSSAGVMAAENMPVSFEAVEVCRKMGVAEQTFYRWRNKYAGLLPSDVKRLKQLEEENRKLKQLVADLSLDKKMLQDVISKKF